VSSDETFPGEADLLAAAQQLTYVDTGESEAELLAQLPPPGDADAEDMLVVTSVRIPLGLHRRLREYAEAHGARPSVLIREWIELHLSAADEDRPILLADAMRALAQLRPAGHRDAA
jgi:predicted DNA-binding protein